MVCLIGLPPPLMVLPLFLVLPISILRGGVAQRRVCMCGTEALASSIGTWTRTSLSVDEVTVNVPGNRGGTSNCAQVIATVYSWATWAGHEFDEPFHTTPATRDTVCVHPKAVPAPCRI